MDLTITDSQNGKIFEGSALENPLPSNCLDVILNVESSHCYHDQPKAFSENFRVLRPGGYLLWADMRPVGYRLDLCFTDPVEVGFEVRKEPWQDSNFPHQCNVECETPGE